MRGVHTNGETIISVLKFVGLLRPDGTPTDLWDAIRDRNPANKVKFADAVRTAYRDVFAQYEHADREDDQTLVALFETQEQATPPVQRARLKTFRTLVKYGDFDALPESSAHNEVVLPGFMRRVQQLEDEIHRVQDEYGAVGTRMKEVRLLQQKLDELGLRQNVLLSESLRAIEAGLFRAAHVLAWGGFIDFFCEQFSVDAVKQRYQNWTVESTDDLHWIKEEQLIEAGKKLDLYRESVAKTLRGLLNDRNQLAHGSGHFPGMAETLGYMTKLFRVVEEIQS